MKTAMGASEETELLKNAACERVEAKMKSKNNTILQNYINRNTMFR